MQALYDVSGPEFLQKNAPGHDPDLIDNPLGPLVADDYRLVW